MIKGGGRDIRRNDRERERGEMRGGITPTKGMKEKRR